MQNIEPLILSVDTATESRSVCVARGAQRLALASGEGRNTHSANVLSEIDSALGMAGVKLSQIELFAAAAGPGSFTGLRAGLATLKAFAVTLGRPVVGVPTLHAVARAAVAAPAETDVTTPAETNVVAAIPAGRGEVFAQFLSLNSEGHILELCEPAHVSPAALLDAAVSRSGAALTWAGGGAWALAEAIRIRALREGLPWFEEEAGESEREGARGACVWTLARPAKVLAEYVSALALAAFRAGRAANANELHAVYVRPSDAELNERCRAPNSLSK